MAEADITAQDLSSKTISALGLSYEQQLALVESMMTCYDTPLTQSAGYTRDLLKTIIALQKKQMHLLNHVLPVGVKYDISDAIVIESRLKADVVQDVWDELVSRGIICELKWELVSEQRMAMDALKRACKWTPAGSQDRDAVLVAMAALTQIEGG